MVRATEVEQSAAKKVLLYGPPKSGKTEAAAKLAEKYNLIYVDIENGRDTIFKLPQEVKANIDIVRIPDTRDYPIAAETLLKIIRGHKCLICWEHGKISCPHCMDIKTKEPKAGALITEVCMQDMGPNDIIVFDSLTQFTNSLISNMTRNRPDDYKLDWDDWGHLGKLFDIFLSHVQNWERNIVCISHEVAVDMPDKSEKLVPVAGTRNFSRNAAKYFGEVVYCEVVNKKHKMGSSTTYKSNIITGSRAGVQLETKDIPNLLEIFQ